MDSLWSYWGHHLPYEHLRTSSSTFTCRKMLPFCAARRRQVTRSVTWASGCACRRHSPGNGTLGPGSAPPHCHCPLERVACRSELTRAPSLGTAEQLGDISGVETRPEGGETGPGRGSSVRLGLCSGCQPSPGGFCLNLSGSSAGTGAFWSCSQANSFQRPLASTGETQLSGEFITNQRGPLGALGWKLTAVVPQALIRHGQVGGPHAGRVLWEGGTVRTGSYMLAVTQDTVLAKVLGVSEAERAGPATAAQHQVLTTGHHGDWRVLEWPGQASCLVMLPPCCWLLGLLVPLAVGGR